MSPETDINYTPHHQEGPIYTLFILFILIIETLKQWESPADAQQCVLESYRVHLMSYNTNTCNELSCIHHFVGMKAIFLLVGYFLYSTKRMTDFEKKSLICLYFKGAVTRKLTPMLLCNVRKLFL